METSPIRNSKKKPLTGGRRDCGLTVIGLSIVLMFWWWQHISTVPETDIPMPRLPVPNAHDTYVAAGNALKDTKKFDFAIQSDHTSADVNDHPYTLAQKQALLDKNRVVFALIQVGLHQAYYAPPIRSYYTLTPYYSNFRSMSRLLRLKEQVGAARGDWNGAVNSCLNAVQMGTQLPRGAILLGEMSGNVMQAIGRHDVWPVIEHLNAAQSRSAIARLQQIRAQAVPLTQVMQEEEWAWQACLQEIFRQPNWMKNFSGSNNNSEEGDSFQQWINQTRLMLYGKRGIMMNYTRYMDQMREVTKSRYGAHLKYPEIPNDPVSHTLVPVYDKLGCRYAENQTQNDMLLLALCLRAYRLEHGAYPHMLAELCPAYLPQLPEDPFAAQGGYGYKLKGSAHVLYSVGPDDKDDGGTSIDDKTKITKQFPHSQARYFVQIESKGDIVAGINP